MVFKPQSVLFVMVTLDEQDLGTIPQGTKQKSWVRWVLEACPGGGQAGWGQGQMMWVLLGGLPPSVLLSWPRDKWS